MEVTGPKQAVGCDDVGDREGLASEKFGVAQKLVELFIGEFEVGGQNWEYFWMSHLFRQDVCMT